MIDSRHQPVPSGRTHWGVDVTLVILSKGTSRLHRIRCADAGLPVSHSTKAFLEPGQMLLIGVIHFVNATASSQDTALPIVIQLGRG